MTINEKLTQLRKAMIAADVDAYIVPSSDPHQSEYFAEYWKVREWISGFTGSMGTAVVTRHHAGVWTDSRYFLQAETELADSEFVLHKQVVQGAPEYLEWIIQQLPQGGRIGIDATLFSVAQYQSMQAYFESGHLQLVAVDLLTQIWKNRPILPKSPIFEHEVRFAGRTRTEKLSDIRSKMAAYPAQWLLVTTLDDIAWTLNIRGRDVECNPVAYCYLLIGMEKCILFMDLDKIPPQLKEKLNDEHIFMSSYPQVAHFILNQLPNDERVMLDFSTTNYSIFQQIQAKTVQAENIPMRLKAIKNPVEMQHIRQVMAKDGAALVRAWRWLETELAANGCVTEYDFAQMLSHFRSEMPLYFGESFNAIVGYRGNGAIVHYRPESATAARILPEGILLIDSGGQYEDGTTDITRTIALSAPTEEQKLHYTLVLKGHIAVASLQFPAGTRGGQVDTIARIALWAQGLNYGHGTGHGVGFFMNVHEPPQGFGSIATVRGKTVLEMGMFTSNEPGFYKTGEYGIRIENLMLTQPAQQTAFGQFLKFETVTCFPIDTTLIQKNLLTEAEKAWLNEYHRFTFAQIKPFLNETETEWLHEKCKPIV